MQKKCVKNARDRDTTPVKKICAAAASVLAGVLLAATPASASVALKVIPQAETCFTNPYQIFDVTSPGGSTYGLTQNEFDTSEPEETCTDGGTDFTIESSSIDQSLPYNQPGGYTGMFRGCLGYGTPCTPDSGFPIPASDFASSDPVHLSMNATLPDNGNDAYDLDFDSFFLPPGCTMPCASGENELMIWLTDAGGIHPGGTEIAQDVNIDGAEYDVIAEQVNSDTSVISYLAVTPQTSYSGISFSGFVNDAVSRGYLLSTNDLTYLAGGYEVYENCAGAAIGPAGDFEIATPDGG
jgi:hypothetical protein